MKALTIFQPWATLIMAGAKPYEFRTWDYTTRDHSLAGQRIVIHSAARSVKFAEVVDLIDRLTRHGSVGSGTALKPEIALPILERMQASMLNHGIHYELPLASGLGTATLLKPRRVTDLFRGAVADSDRLEQHLWAWPLQAIEPFPHPIPARGAQGFWNWPKDLEVAA